jgi:Predicted N-acetylglucosaminyl transferase
MRLCCALAVFVAALGFFQYGWCDVKATTSKPMASSKAPDSVGASAQATGDTAKPQEKSATSDTGAVVDMKKMGDQYLKQAKTENAMEAYKQWIEKNDKDTAAIRIAKLLGDYCFAKKQYDEAVRYFSMAAVKNREPALKIMLGKSMLYAGKSKEAIAILEPLSASPKLTPDVRRDLLKTIGDAYSKADMAGKAVAWYGKYLKQGGTKNADIMFAIAVSQEGASPARVKQLYEENIKKFPTDYRNYLHLSVLLSKNKATAQRSAALLKKAVACAPNLPAAWTDIARIYGSLGKTDDELSAYRASLRADTANIEARTRIGTILLKKGEIAEALKLLEETHAMAPDSVGPMAALASAYLKSGKANEAVDMLVKTKAARPKDPTVRKQLFDAYSASGQDPLALEEIKALLDLKRDNESLLAYGKLLLKMGKLDEAANTMEDIRSTAPDNVEALMTLAKVLRAQKKLNEAIQIYTEVSSIDQKYAPALFERAEVYLAQDKIKWAEQFYKRALGADPKMGLAELGLAKLALVYKNHTAYLEYLDKAAVLDPDNPLIKQELENSKNQK